MKYSILSLVLAVSALGQGPVKVTKVPAPAKALIFEVNVPATVDAVWTAFTKSEALSTWLTPGAVVNLRQGGEWTAHFPGGGTGGGTILSFTPKHTLVMSAMAPETFPHVRRNAPRLLGNSWLSMLPRLGSP